MPRKFEIYCVISEEERTDNSDSIQCIIYVFLHIFTNPKIGGICEEEEHHYEYLLDLFEVLISLVFC